MAVSAAPMADPAIPARTAERRVRGCREPATAGQRSRRPRGRRRQRDGERPGAARLERRRGAAGAKPRRCAVRPRRRRAQGDDHGERPAARGRACDHAGESAGGDAEDDRRRHEDLGRTGGSVATRALGRGDRDLETRRARSPPRSPTRRSPRRRPRATPENASRRCRLRDVAPKLRTAARRRSRRAPLPRPLRAGEGRRTRRGRDRGRAPFPRATAASASPP